MKNADEAELQLLASQPLELTVHNVQGFPQLGTLAGLLSCLICQKVQGRSRAPGERRVGEAGQGPPLLAAALPGHFGQRDRAVVVRPWYALPSLSPRVPAP